MIIVISSALYPYPTADAKALAEDLAERLGGVVWSPYTDVLRAVGDLVDLDASKQDYDRPTFREILLRVRGVLGDSVFVDHTVRYANIVGRPVIVASPMSRMDRRNFQAQGAEFVPVPGPSADAVDETYGEQMLNQLPMKMIRPVDEG